MVSFTSQISFALLLLISVTTFNRTICCNDEDRKALLMFKQGVVDPSNRLYDWSSQKECCEWTGVGCDVGRVSMLLLGNYEMNDSTALRGQINLSLSQLDFLSQLDLSYNDFEAMSMPSVHDSAVNHSHPHANSSVLECLDLSFNIYLRMNSLHWLSPLSSLKILRLQGIDLHKETSWLHTMASFSSLSELNLAGCQLTNIAISAKKVNFSSVVSLDLSENYFDSELPIWLFNLSNDLSFLNLGNNNFRGQIPDWSHYRSLQNLIMYNNKLKGPIPDWLGQLETLQYLDLFSNSFHGSIPSNLGNLSFPEVSNLDISFNALSGSLPKSLSKPFGYLDLSYNSICGDLSNMLLTSDSVYLASNKFDGELPRISANVAYLDLADNSFSGSLSRLLGPSENKPNSLVFLDISNNLLSGGLPDYWMLNWKYLQFIFLGSNNLRGKIPPSVGSLIYLEALDLHNNSFFGDIPSSLPNCTGLVLLNLERNNLSGSIPHWKQQSLSIIQLRSNQFIGNIPSQQCRLPNLIVLDLADNKLSGLIPQCLYNLTSMVSSLSQDARVKDYPYTGGGRQTSHDFKIMVHTKGQQLEYLKSLKLLRSIDLSANKLSGEIPPQLFWLVKLKSLNLSYNHLTGKIPGQIGMMRDLESLDFSHNKIYGKIPQSISNLSFLSNLNLSYNNFKGQIPLGTQLQSFDAWSYIGNPELCGAPLIKNCTKPEKPNQKQLAEEDEDDSFLKSLYLGMGVGFAVAFWIVSGSLFLNRACRHTYFRFLYGVADHVYVFVAIKFQRFRRILGHN